MKITNETKIRMIEISKIDSEDKLPSICLSLFLKTDEIESRFKRSIWIEVQALDLFISDLSQLENTRSGFAHLEGMSPGTFRLEIKSKDELGHLWVNFRISKRAADQSYADQIQVGFEIDPTSLPNLIKDLNVLKLN